MFSIPTFFCSIARTDTTAMRLPVVIQDFNSFDFEAYLAMVRLLLTIPPNTRMVAVSVPTGPGNCLVYWRAMERKDTHAFGCH